MKVNEEGIKTDCFGYDKKKKECNILTGWYGTFHSKCENCPFYKTRGQLQTELERIENG